MRNKAKNFPHTMSPDGEARAKDEYASKRTDGKTQTQPQERMSQSNRS
ncbi:small, acid-soluble spore protein K [Bacillus sp. Marseille-Q3570]|nr:small, acid-soluble spore protein K [Bacillus sp. Marseille-Q3570]